MTKKGNKNELPLVSVCTPTFNRRPFIKNLFACFNNQDYPKNRIEWIIVDDGTDKISDLIETSNIPQIRYISVEKKMKLGAKRNYMHTFVRGSIVVYMDDDDYYPPDRISHAVDKLTQNPQALCAGSSEIYVYFKHINSMYQCGPYGPNHATAGTFAFKSELLRITKYEEDACVAEERSFLKDYTIPFVQLDPLKSILVFSHDHNTYDKRKMLVDMHPDFMRLSNKTVDDFIRKANEQNIKNFFLNEIPELLKNYEPGQAKMKPDVLKQISEIEQEREKIKEQLMKQAAANNGPIMLQQPGKEPVALSNQDVVNILAQQQNIINELNQKLQSVSGEANQINELRIKDLESMVSMLQKELIEKNKNLKNLKMLNGELIVKLTAIEEKLKNKEIPPPPPPHKVPIEIVDTTSKIKIKSEPEYAIYVNFND